MNAFTSVYNAISTQVAYDSTWANGTGYLNGAVRADLGIQPGLMARSIDPSGRQIVLIGTTMGNIAVFERYTPSADNGKDSVIVSNLPESLSRLMAGICGIGSALTEEGVRLLIGDEIGATSKSPTVGSNFGSRMLRAAAVSGSMCSRKHRQ